ncbi:WXG100 family type VII secretion target [Mycobacterium sp. NPDC049093]
MRVSREALTDTAESVEDAAQSLQSEFDRISGLVDEVVGASWTGQAADGIGADWARWCDGFADVMAGLRREGQALRIAAARYSSTDATGATALSQAMRL